MKIRKLKLFTNKFDLEKIFYSETLGFEIIESTSDSFTLKIGWSYLTFQKTEKEYKYHYCFLIFIILYIIYIYIYIYINFY